jgi:hypothetical protein
MSEVTEVRTISEVVHFATKAAAEAYREVADAGGKAKDADYAARQAFRNNLPTLESRASVQAFLAAVVRGLELHLLSANESQQFVRAARLWVTASKREGEVAA